MAHRSKQYLATEEKSTLLASMECLSLISAITHKTIEASSVMINFYRFTIHPLILNHSQCVKVTKCTLVDQSQREVKQLLYQHDECKAYNSLHTLTAFA